MTEVFSSLAVGPSPLSEVLGSIVNTFETLLLATPAPEDRARVWRRIKYLSPLLQLNSHWKVGNARKVSLWYEKWSFPMAQSLPFFTYSVVDMVSSLFAAGQWKISTHLPLKFSTSCLQGNPGPLRP